MSLPFSERMIQCVSPSFHDIPLRSVFEHGHGNGTKSRLLLFLRHKAKLVRELGFCSSALCIVTVVENITDLAPRFMPCAFFVFSPMEAGTREILLSYLF